MTPMTKSICNFLVLLLLLAGCSSSPNGPDADVTPPPVPAGLEIVTIGNGSVTLSWTAVSDKGLMGYNVYWSASVPADTLHAEHEFSLATTYTISGLDYTTLYYFAVASLDKSGNVSALSVQENGIPGNTTGPKPPRGADAVAENITTPTITLSWIPNDEPDVAHYNIYRALSADGIEEEDTPLSAVDTPGYLDTDVEVSVSYYYRVTAVDTGGWESAPSSIVSDMVLPEVHLTAPLNFQYVTANPKLSWEPVDGAVKYQVVISRTRIGGEVWDIETDASSAEVTYNGKTKLTPGEKYYWRVGAISRSEINSVSELGSFQVMEQ